MSSKKCFKCGEEKDLSAFYKHKMMGDGHLNKCIICTKKDVKSREDRLKNDPSWVERERQRGREKYHKLYSDGRHNPSKERKRKTMARYIEMYPEKYEARSHSRHIKSLSEERHHWSYNKEHYKDVVHLTKKEHSKAHIYMIYDQERKMYRRSDNMELLDTKEKHVDYIWYVIKNKPD